MTYLFTLTARYVTGLTIGLRSSWSDSYKTMQVRNVRPFQATSRKEMDALFFLNTTKAPNMYVSGDTSFSHSQEHHMTTVTFWRWIYFEFCVMLTNGMQRRGLTAHAISPFTAVSSRLCSLQLCHGPGVSGNQVPYIMFYATTWKSKSNWPSVPGRYGQLVTWLKFCDCISSWSVSRW